MLEFSDLSRYNMIKLQTWMADIPHDNGMELKTLETIFKSVGLNISKIKEHNSNPKCMVAISESGEEIEFELLKGMRDYTNNTPESRSIKIMGKRSIDGVYEVSKRLFKIK